jgi:hypothetical protein
MTQYGGLRSEKTEDIKCTRATNLIGSHCELEILLHPSFMFRIFTLQISFGMQEISYMSLAFYIYF